MSTLEATVDMMERLSEENLVKVQYVTRQLLMTQENGRTQENIMTKQRFLEELELSRQQANAGRYRDAQEVVNDIRRGVLYKNDK
ncbi:MAG: hypothetical protein BHW11_11035 [Clostridium sp. CAG:62_40_43]|nr:MAG: hypothetical protein BHW11_11035 [Clostridium sp. CAG:62_40_43]HAY04114.1 hypothetical protein [Lachnospiraceae bacterium]